MVDVMYNKWICGAMVARLTPDQKVACSIHVRFNPLLLFSLFFFFFLKHILGLGYYSDELGLKAHFIMNVFCKLQSISLGM
jgi:hypothetical protein